MNFKYREKHSKESYSSQTPYQCRAENFLHRFRKSVPSDGHLVDLSRKLVTDQRGGEISLGKLNNVTAIPCQIVQ